jgi:hypothetical protein
MRNPRANVSWPYATQRQVAQPCHVVDGERENVIAKSAFVLERRGKRARFAILDPPPRKLADRLFCRMRRASLAANDDRTELIPLELGYVALAKQISRRGLLPLLETGRFLNPLPPPALKQCLSIEVDPVAAVLN